MPTSDESDLQRAMSAASVLKEDLAKKRPDGWENLDDENQVRAVLRKLKAYETLSDNLTSTQERCNTLIEEARSERRRRKKLEAALHQILQWDCLNPEPSDICSNFPWLKKLVENALKND